MEGWETRVTQQRVDGALPGIIAEDEAEVLDLAASATVPHGDMKVAWFKDPDGNILNLVNR
jgi:hypothetical protein